jgi:hypothetical protein
MWILTNTDLTANQRLAQFLADEFLIRGYEWNFGTEAVPDRRIPNEQELLNAFEELKRTTPEGSFQIASHLVAIHWQGHFDIYTHVGEIE